MANGTLSMRASVWASSDLPQKEHFRRSPPSPNFATRLSPLTHACHLRHLRQLATHDDFVDEAVVPGLVGTHDEVPVGVLADLLLRLTGVVGQDAIEQLA